MTGEALSSRPPASKTLHGHAGEPLCWGGVCGAPTPLSANVPKRCKRARESRFRREARERGTCIRVGAPLKGVRLHDDEDTRPAGPEATPRCPERGASWGVATLVPPRPVRSPLCNWCKGDGAMSVAKYSASMWTERESLHRIE